MAGTLEAKQRGSGVEGHGWAPDTEHEVSLLRHEEGLRCSFAELVKSDWLVNSYELAYFYWYSVDRPYL